MGMTIFTTVPHKRAGFRGLPQLAQWTALENLESVYRNALDSGGFSLSSAFRASFLYILYVITSIEFIMIISGIFFVSGTFGIMMATMADNALGVGFFWLVMAMITVSVSFITSLIFTTICFFREWDFWVMTVVTTVVVSLSLSFFLPVLWGQFTDAPMPDRFGLFWLLFALYGATRFFLILTHENKLCFWIFKQRFLDNDLELDIPVPLRGALLSISAQDQSTKLTTTRGSHILAQGFGKAIKRVRNVKGMRVHRSHWVAKNAIRKIEKNSGREVVVLRNGQHLPVSSKKICALKELFGGNIPDK